MSAAVHALDLNALGLWAWLVILVCVALSVVIAQLVLVGLVYPGLQRYAVSTRSLWILACLVAGFALLEVIPITIYPKTQVVRIVALGKKDPASNGSEVWIDKIMTGRSAYPLQQSSCRGNWRSVDHLVMAPAELQPATLNCRIRTDDDIELEFVTHAWSGKAQVVYENEKTTLDLYDPGSTEIDLILDVRLSPRDKLLRSVLLIAAGLSLGFGLLAATVWLASVPVIPVTARGLAWPSWPVYTLLIAAVWGVYLLVFWPGFLSPDSTVQFMQMTSGPLRNSHPAIHTMFLWLLTRVRLSPWPVVMAQILVLAALLGFSLDVLRRLGVPRWVTWIIALSLAFSPALGSIILNPWKDVAFSIAVVAMTIMMIYWYALPRQNRQVLWPANKRLLFWAAFGAVAALAVLFRHNGIVVGFGTLFILILADRRHWKELALALLVCAAIYAAVTGPLYAALKVETAIEANGRNMSPYYNAGYMIRYQFESGTPLTPQESDLVTQLFATESGLPNREFAALHSAELLQSAVAVSLRNPLPTLRFLLTKAGFIFQVLQPANARLEYHGGVIVSNPFGIQPASRLPRLQPYFEKLLLLSQQPQFDWLFWRNALWMYLLIIAGLLAVARLKQGWPLLTLLPMLLNALPMAFITGGDIARYILPSLILGPLLGFGLLFIQPIQPAEAAAAPGPISPPVQAAPTSRLSGG